MNTYAQNVSAWRRELTGGLAALLILAWPARADAYLDPTGGGFLLQLLLGGLAGVILFGRILVRRVVDALAQRFRRHR